MYKKCMVLGTGIMGMGITQLLAQHGIDTLLFTRDFSTGQKKIDDLKLKLARSTAKGIIQKHDIEVILKHVTISTHLRDAQRS